MGCSFANVENACGCIIGYNLPLQTVEGADITGYPVHVLNVNGDDLGEVNSPSEYAAIWNLDEDNKAVGTLYVMMSYCFFLSFKSGITPPSNVLGTSAQVDAGFRVWHGETALDTTGEPPVLQDYLNAKVLAFDGDDFDVVAPSGSDVEIDFDNASDKVLYIQVDPSEAPFTKWSEVGNSLQQNQPIDSSFSSEGTAVIFAYKDPDTQAMTYFTRFQTSFTGAIILSR